MIKNQAGIYLYLVDGVDDDDDVSLMARRQSFKPAWELLQDLTGLQRQTRDGPEVLQQLRGGSRTILKARGYRVGKPGRKPSYLDREPLDDEDRL